MTANDPRRDMVDENGKPASGPPYQDITKVAVAAQGLTLQLDMWVAAAPPTVDTLHEQIGFNWYIDTNGDGSPDWQVFVSNDNAPSEMNAPGWDASLSDISSGKNLMAQDFPGTLTVAGNHVSVSLLLVAIGFPSQVWVAASTESEVWPDPVKKPTTYVSRRDFVPDSQWPDGSEWLTVAASP